MSASQLFTSVATGCSGSTTGAGAGASTGAGALTGAASTGAASTGAAATGSLDDGAASATGAGAGTSTGAAATGASTTGVGSAAGAATGAGSAGAAASTTASTGAAGVVSTASTVWSISLICLPQCHTVVLTNSIGVGGLVLLVHRVDVHDVRRLTSLVRHTCLISGLAHSWALWGLGRLCGFLVGHALDGCCHHLTLLRHR